VQVSVTITGRAEVNLAWWLAWTSNPVGIYRKVGSVGSIPIHLRHLRGQVWKIQFLKKTEFSRPDPSLGVRQVAAVLVLLHAIAAKYMRHGRSCEKQ
jgi:hypothetical protein